MSFRRKENSEKLPAERASHKYQLKFLTYLKNIHKKRQKDTSFDRIIQKGKKTTLNNQSVKFSTDSESNSLRQTNRAI